MTQGTKANGLPRLMVNEKTKLKITVWAATQVDKLNTLTAEEASMLIQEVHGVTLPGKAVRRIYEAVGASFCRPVSRSKKKSRAGRPQNGNRLRALARVVRDGFIQAGIPFDAAKTEQLCKGTGEVVLAPLPDLSDVVAKAPTLSGHHSTK